MGGLPAAKQLPAATLDRATCVQFKECKGDHIVLIEHPEKRPCSGKAASTCDVVTCCMEKKANEEAPCFPSEATAIVSGSSVQVMSELEVGTQVFVEGSYEPVIGFAH